MQIKIKALADIEFLSAKVDKNIILFTYRLKIFWTLLEKTVILMDV